MKKLQMKHENQVSYLNNGELLLFENIRFNKDELKMTINLVKTYHL